MVSQEVKGRMRAQRGYSAEQKWQRAHCAHTCYPQGSMETMLSDMMDVTEARQSDGDQA